MDEKLLKTIEKILIDNFGYTQEKLDASKKDFKEFDGKIWALVEWQFKKTSNEVDPMMASQLIVNSLRENARILDDTVTKLMKGNKNDK